MWRDWIGLCKFLLSTDALQEFQTVGAATWKFRFWASSDASNQHVLGLDLYTGQS